MDNKFITEIIAKNKGLLKEAFDKIDEIALFNQKKVLEAFQKNKIALRHFNGTTGYGYDDDGRDSLKRVYADVFHAEKAVISPNIVSGTHALSLALFSILRGGDRILFATGKPYDTLQEVIEGERLSLKELGVTFDYVNLIDVDFDYDKISQSIKENMPTMVYVQKSRGYEDREAVSNEKIKKLNDFIKDLGFEGCLFVDNCYGEFVEKTEPTDVGADIVAGSLIKNIGGGIAPTGGYVAGKAEYIDLVEARLTSPSIAGEVGSYAFGYQYFYQGLFLAPHVVSQALKGSMLIGAVMEELGFETTPKAFKTPFDITRSVKMKNEKNLVSFIQSVQSVSPIDSFVSVIPAPMPGYSHKVVMAAGCFVQGSSIELSCDAPIKEPFNAFIQGGLTFEHVEIALFEILKNL